MKGTKERLRRVLVIGANPAGIAATNKLGELGIPVTLVDPDADLNKKLSNERWRLSSGLSLNYALRPGLIRILRNPSIRTLIPSRVIGIKHTQQGFAVRLTDLQTFVDSERCLLCGRCVEVCPATTPDGTKPIAFPGRQSLPGRPTIDKRRQPSCQESCPLGVNVQGYVALTRIGKYTEALELIRRDNVLPGICGRVCTHPCELACRRSELDEPLAIRDIKRFVADFVYDHHLSPEKTGKSGEIASRRHEKKSVNRQRIAIIGSGPAGLAAAADLARWGYPVDVYEKEMLPGGLLRYGIGPHRLPRDMLDKEIEYIEKLGVSFITGRSVNLPEDLAWLQKDYASIILATGTWLDRKLGVSGEENAKVQGCIEFLSMLYRNGITKLNEKVAVIGDGNAAFDLARVLLRLRADVVLLSWFPKDLIPADAEEISASEEEGVTIIDRVRVTGFVESPAKELILHCAKTEPGEPDANGIPWPVVVPGEEPFEMRFDRAIVAIGQTGDWNRNKDPKNPETTPSGFIVVNNKCKTSIPQFYAAGDAVTGPSSVVHAMASGRRAARSVHEALSGERIKCDPLNRPSNRDFPQIGSEIPSVSRVRMPEKQPSLRKHSLAEVALGLTEILVQAEAERCLQCGVCSECLECIRVCVQPRAIQSNSLPSDLVEHVGAVIIADPEAAPPVKGEDVLRAYSAKATKTDAYGMMLRGFAAAAEAMNLLGGSALRMKGHGLSFSPPDPQLSPELRLGIFVCRCNDSLGWSSAFDEYLNSLKERGDIEHVEALQSACTPEGGGAILRTIREKSLTRIVLGTCVCCPLDFICSTCTDQRSRLKEALFNATGVSRGMVETCNLRGEALRLLASNSELAERRFAGLLERSIGRARKLRTLPSPARPYNFTTAVIGDSKAALRSAMTLAQAGMEVFLFGNSHSTLSASLEHPNIHIFKGLAVKGLRGTVGNFQVIVESNGNEQFFSVGAVILGEKSRKHIPYMPMAELPQQMVEYSMQKRGLTDIPFFYPGATSIPGLALANPPGIAVSERIKGAAAAVLAATVMPRRPRQNKGYTVVVDAARCRGCGRCMQVCPYKAVTFQPNEVEGWYAVVDQALCKGCGNCIAVCPSNAADSPYRDRAYLEQMIEEILL